MCRWSSAPTQLWSQTVQRSGDQENHCRWGLGRIQQSQWWALLVHWIIHLCAPLRRSVRWCWSCLLHNFLFIWLSECQYVLVMVSLRWVGMPLPRRLHPPQLWKESWIPIPSWVNKELFLNSHPSTNGWEFLKIFSVLNPVPSALKSQRPLTPH